MTPIEPRVAIFSYSPIPCNFITRDADPWVAKHLEIHQFYNDVSSDLLVNNRFNFLIFVGNTKSWLKSQNNNIPRIFVNQSDELNGDLIYDNYITQTVIDYNPPISVFTPAYRTMEKFDRLHQSMLAQSHTNWEWIIVDDSPGLSNHNYIKNKIGNDHRIKLYKPDRNDGLVGSMKRQAASLCNGTYIMEVDHDDELHHLALEICLNAFKKFPDAGFCYSNAAEVFENGGVVNYGAGYALGHGQHFTYKYKGRELLGSDTPINANTIRHIVGAPNHFRCWRKDLYFQIGRHNSKLGVVDDYELLIRTFLSTRMIHIKEVLYIQYMNSGGNNTQEPRRAEIQRLVNRISSLYDRAIHNRIISLGGTDWAWNESTNSSNYNLQPPNELRRSTLAYEYKI